MTYLIDTHVLLWAVFEEERLSRTARRLLRDPDNRILVSSASAWEIATKHRLGKLPDAGVLARDVFGWVQRIGFEELPITLRHAQKAGEWPQPHRDPFDRMLAAQSALEAIPLVTSDRAFGAFAIDLAW